MKNEYKSWEWILGLFYPVAGILFWFVIIHFIIKFW